MKSIAVIHHSYTPKDIAADKAERSFNNTHKSKNFPRSKSGWYIGYHWVIYGNGETRRYRADSEGGAHTSQQGMNFKSIGICLSGNFDKEHPNPAQVKALTKLLKKYNFKEIYPHRKFATYKSCYGDNLADGWASNLISKKNKDMFLAIKFKGEGTVYAVLGRTLLPFPTKKSFEHAGGDFAQVVDVPVSEKGKFDIRRESPVIKKP